MPATYRLMAMPQDLPREWPDEPTVTEMAADAALEALLLARRDRARVQIMPRDAGSLRPIPDFADPARPLYLDRDTSATLWDLEERGVDVAVLHDEDERDNYGIKSADVVISMAVFVGQILLESEIMAIYAHLKDRVAHTRRWLAASGEPDTRVTITFDYLSAEKTAEGSKITIKNYAGPADATIELITRALHEINEAA